MVAYIIVMLYWSLVLVSASRQPDVWKSSRLLNLPAPSSKSYDVLLSKSKRIISFSDRAMANKKHFIDLQLAADTTVMSYSRHSRQVANEVIDSSPFLMLD